MEVEFNIYLWMRMRMSRKRRNRKRQMGIWQERSICVEDRSPVKAML